MYLDPQPNYYKQRLNFITRTQNFIVGVKRGLQLRSEETFVAS